jgi:hypothetical protein
MTERKGFNFYKSYFDVYNELSDKEKVKFMDALLQRQFWGAEPSGLGAMSKFAYISQKHNINAQVKGYEDKTGNTLHPPIAPPPQGANEPPLGQEEEEGKGEEEGKEEVTPPYRKFKHLSLSKNEFTKLRTDYSIEQIDGILDSIENHKKNTNYSSLYLTAIKWLKNDKKSNIVDDGRYIKKDLTNFEYE